MSGSHAPIAAGNPHWIGRKCATRWGPGHAADLTRVTTSPRALALGLAALLLAGCSTSGYTVGPGGLPTPTRTSSPSPRATPRAARTSPALATPAPVTSPGPAAVRY